jgi:hypothetical protein
MVQQIDPSTYVLAHTTSGCSCRLHHIDTLRLAHALSMGQILLLEIAETDTGGMTVAIRPYQPGENLVALSHVWAEGLGNPSANALHEYELIRLSRLSSALTGDGRASPLWVDAMCVPVSPPKLHQLAMAKMRDPYRLASYVLVLDEYLMGHQAVAMDTTEIFARVQSGSWAQRLWTLQEGRLGRRVLFQFADRAVSLQEEFAKISLLPIPAQVSRFIQVELIWEFEAVQYTDTLPDYNGRITSTRRAIKNRSVSVPSDEALCVACLMNLELDEIPDKPVAD